MTKPFFTKDDADYVVAIGYSGRLLTPGYGVQESISETSVISLAKANRLLQERGRVVWGQRETIADCNPPVRWSFDSFVDASVGATHRALLINIEPIEQEDSAESFLEAFDCYVKDADRGRWDLSERWRELRKRAKKLLERKDGV